MKGDNNPGNIRAGGGKFIGEVTPAGAAFRHFSSLAYGYRAIGKIFLAYYKKGFNTLEKALNRYAPPSDNNPTNSYVQFVSKGLKIAPQDDLKSILVTPEKLHNLIALISTFEQGRAFNNDVFALADATKMLLDYSQVPVDKSNNGAGLASLALVLIFAAVSR